MNLLHWLFVLMAIFSAVPALTLISPWRVPARAVPMIMILTALCVSFLPEHAVLAIACVGPVAWLYKVFGISVAENEPVNIGPAVELAKRGGQRARERIRRPEPVSVIEFVKPGDPGILSARDDDESDVAEDAKDEPDVSPAEKVTAKLEELASDPSMPEAARQRLGQQPSALNRTITRVPQYVPAL